LNSFRVQKIPPPLLKKFSEGCYVDSPVYFEAPGWVRWLNWTKLERLYGMMPRREDLVVLDFACGNGVMFPTWEAYEKMTVAIDLHVGAAQRVRKHYGMKRVSLVRGEGPILPFGKESFDLVFAASSLEHFPDPTPPLREIHRVLRKGGQMLFLCPNENRFYDWGRRVAGYKKPPDHYSSADEVLTRVQSFFQVEKTSRFPLWAPSPLAVYKMGRAVKK
jgi:ubiquinone/menaquinone biosynthesis C-methylase UbiE